MLSHSALHALFGNWVWPDFVRLVKKGAKVDKAVKWKTWTETRGVLKTFPALVAGKRDTKLAQEKKVFGATYSGVINDMVELWSNASSFAYAHFLHFANTVRLEDLRVLTRLTLTLDQFIDRIVSFHFRILAKDDVKRNRSTNEALWAIADPILRTTCDPKNVEEFGAPEELRIFRGKIGSGLQEGNFQLLQANMARVHCNVLRRIGANLRYIVGSLLSPDERLACAPAQLLSLCSSIATARLVRFARSASTNKNGKLDLFGLLKVPVMEGSRFMWRRMSEGLAELSNAGDFLVTASMKPKKVVPVVVEDTVFILLGGAWASPKDVFAGLGGDALFSALKAHAHSLKSGKSATALRVCFCRVLPPGANEKRMIDVHTPLPKLVDKAATQVALKEWTTRIFGSDSEKGQAALATAWLKKGLILDWRESGDDDGGPVVGGILTKIDEVVQEIAHDAGRDDGPCDVSVKFGKESFSTESLLLAVVLARRVDTAAKRYEEEFRRLYAGASEQAPQPDSKKAKTDPAPDPLDAALTRAAAQLEPLQLGAEAPEADVSLNVFRADGIEAEQLEKAEHRFSCKFFSNGGKKTARLHNIFVGDSTFVEADIQNDGAYRPFRVTRRAFLSPGTYSVFLVPTAPPKRPDLLLGPAPSYRRTFAVLNPRALHDALRISVERFRADRGDAEFAAVATSLVADLRARLPELAPPPDIVDLVSLFLSEKTGQFNSGKKAHEEQAKMATLLLLGSRRSTISQAYRGTKVVNGVRQYGLISHVFTNGFEIHVAYMKEKTKEERDAKKRTKAKEEDAALFATAQRAASLAQERSVGAVDFYYSGSAGVDPGMNGLAVASHATSDEAYLWNAALEVLDDPSVTATLDLPKNDKKGRYETELGLERVTHERRQKWFDWKIRQRRALLEAGAVEHLEPAVSWEKCPVANIPHQFADFKSSFVFRSRFYREELFARQSLYSSRALLILAKQMCDTAEDMVGRMGEAAESGELFKGGGGIRITSKGGWRPSKIAATPLAAFDDVVTRDHRKEDAEDSGDRLSVDIASDNKSESQNNNNVTTIKMYNTTATASGNSNDNNNNDETAMVNKIAPKKRRVGPKSGTKITVPPPVINDGKRPVFLGHLAVGDWCGVQPRGFRANNSFPRKTLLRLVVKELRRRAEKDQWKESGVLVVPHLVSEYRMSRQAPCMRHRVSGDRIDRHNARSEECRAEKLEKGHKTSWKLLVCPECNTIANRDKSAASAIAANHERSLLAERFRCEAPVHAGYARGATTKAAFAAVDAG